jgi:predicted nucleotidyltransferase
MRLRENEIQSIKTIFRDIFKDGEIYLFGSRVDDSKKGGDIDLYISTKNRDNLAQKKIKFAGRVMRAIEYKKVDIVLDYGKNRLIDKIAKKEGIKL